jgi:hypothetical protein
MTRKRPFNVTLEPEMIADLRAIEKASGVKPAEFIRRAVARALKSQRKRVPARKRS